MLIRGNEGVEIDVREECGCETDGHRPGFVAERMNKKIGSWRWANLKLRFWLVVLLMRLGGALGGHTGGTVLCVCGHVLAERKGREREGEGGMTW
jgi:hypothetical protein